MRMGNKKTLPTLHGLEHRVRATIFFMKTDKQPTILLIENHDLNAKTYQGFLKKEPVNFIHLLTGAAALAHLQQSVPDVILLDLGLADMDAMDILKHVQQLECAVIILSSPDTAAVVDDAMCEGAYDFIEKPFNARRLIVTLHNALRQHQLSQATDFIELNNN